MEDTLKNQENGDQSPQEVLHMLESDAQNITDKCAFNHLANMQIAEVEKMRNAYKKMSEESDILKELVLSRMEEFEALQNYCAQRDCEVKQLRKDITELINIRTKMAEENAFESTRYMQLEVKYERNLQEFQQLLDQCNQEIETLKLERLDNIEEFANYRKKMENEMNEMKALLATTNHLIKEKENVISKLLEKQKCLETQIEEEQRSHKSQCENLNATMNEKCTSYKKDIDEKEEIISICRQQMAELEQDKNAIIGELSQKIKGIEHAIEQPIKSVRPLSENVDKPSQNHIVAVSSLREESEDIILITDKVTNTNNVTVSNPRYTTKNANDGRSQENSHSLPIGHKVKKKPRIMSSIKEKSKQLQIRSARKTKQPCYFPSENEFSTDNEADNWVTNTMKTATADKNQNKSKGIAARKRRFSSDDISFVVPPTTSSSDSFDRLKKIK